MKINFLLCLLSVTLYISSMDRDIAFKLKDGISNKPLKYVSMFPALEVFLDLEALADRAQIPVDARSKIFDTWFSLAKDIAVQKGNVAKFPTVYPEALQKKININLKNLSFNDFQAFIELGTYLNVSDDLMQCVCDFFSKKYLSNMKNNSELSINNQMAQAHFGNMLEYVKNMFVLSGGLFKIEKKAEIPLFRFDFTDEYIYSQKNLFIAYMHEYKRPNDDRKRYSVYCCDLSKKDVKQPIQRHSVDNNAKNRKKFIKNAAQEACFLTIAPYDDRILVHHLKDRQKSRAINLNLGEAQEITCCDISANGNYVMVGYNVKSEESNNKYVIYDNTGIPIHTIPTDNSIIVPNECMYHPIDSTTGICTAGSVHRQYSATLENNIIKIPLGQHENFLSGKYLFDVRYGGNGNYIFALGYDEADIIQAYRLDAEFLDQDFVVHDLPILYSQARGMVKNYTNDLGDMCAYHVSFEDEQKKYSRHTIILVDHVNNAIFQIPGHDLISCFLKGYLIVYYEKTVDNKQYLVFFDALHKKELMRDQVSNENHVILGITENYELVTKREKLHLHGEENSVMTEIVLSNMLEISCWEQISRFLDTYNFLPTDVNWLQQMCILVNDIKNSAIFFENWLQKNKDLFNENFVELLANCLKEKITYKRKTLKNGIGLLSAYATYGKKKKEIQKDSSQISSGVAITPSGSMGEPATIPQRVIQQNVLKQTAFQGTQTPPQPHPGFMQRIWNSTINFVKWFFRSVGFSIQ